ncbi:hypothetical protein [Candidatus Villigracilis affinis]|uniref:hypothetical protein n=1 Tax=Candidatus Villigracilis affinis TaxID=3140682 RepID=UPI002A1D8F19|nr:hypothetical protein [Anaerolineales bacterium]
MPAPTPERTAAPRRSACEMAMTIARKSRRKKNLAIGLGNVAGQQLVIGALSAAERNLRRSIDLCREIADELVEAVGHQELGRVLSYRGAWQQAEQELDSNMKFLKKNHVQMQGVTWSYRALRFLLMASVPIPNRKS